MYGATQPVVLSHKRNISRLPYYSRTPVGWLPDHPDSFPAVRTRSHIMQLGVIGLGRMGGNISRRLMRAGHDCVVFDQQADAVNKLEADGAHGAKDLAGLVSQLAKPRAVWVMLPAGEITGKTIEV